MEIIINNQDVLNCLDNNIAGVDLYEKMSTYTKNAYETSNAFNGLKFDGIIMILRAALPMAVSLYQITNKKMGFISAKRREDLSIEINYKNVPKLQNPLLVDAWVASGNTVVEVAKELGIKDISLFCLIASRQSLEFIKPKNLIVGHIAESMTKETYIIPPAPFTPRDGGNDLFWS